MLSPAYIIKKIRRRSISEIIKILNIYAIRGVEGVLLRYACHRNKNRTNYDWSSLLGVQAGIDGLRQIEDQFYMHNAGIFPLPLCSDQYLHDLKSLDFIAKKTITHQFDILGSGWSDVSHAFPDRYKEHGGTYSRGGCGCNKDMLGKLIANTDPQSQLLEALVEYIPIDWQLDFKSGYRWSSSTWSRNIIPGEIAGADIKVPWELSRFYHAGPLAAYWHETKNPAALEEFQMQILDWISANPVYHGVNWRNSMEVGIRAVNWLLGMSYFRDEKALTTEFIWIVSKSLYEHADFILKNLEKNSFGANNHYLGNLVGLVAIAASAPQIPESDGWLVFAVHELMDEMLHQVHDDGTHFEASTSYHRLVAEMFLQSLLIISALPVERKMRLEKAYSSFCKRRRAVARRIIKDDGPKFDSLYVFPQWFVDRLGLMLAYINNLSKPGEELPQIGDNDSGRLSWLPVPFQLNGSDVTWRLNSHSHLLAAAPFFPQPSSGGNTSDHCDMVSKPSAKASQFPEGSLYPDSGIAVYRRDDLYLVVSCGKNGGNSNLGGHAHNDKMSFELAVHGVDIVVDPGTYAYTSSPEERNKFRSTRMHNTVAFADMEQNIISNTHLFELPDNADPRIVFFDKKQLRCEHVGFGFKCIRDFMVREHQVEIVDKTENPGGYCIINLHPSVRFDGKILSHCRASVSITYRNIDKISLQPSYFSPRYGVKIPSNCLVLERAGRETSFCFSWN